MYSASQEAKMEELMYQYPESYIPELIFKYLQPWEKQLIFEELNKEAGECLYLTDTDLFGKDSAYAPFTIVDLVVTCDDLHVNWDAALHECYHDLSIFHKAN